MLLGGNRYGHGVVRSVAVDDDGQIHVVDLAWLGGQDRHLLNRTATPLRPDLAPRAMVTIVAERKVAEGKTKKDAVRSLERHISNAVYRQLLVDAAQSKT
jgi:hypothetical protein